MNKFYLQLMIALIGLSFACFSTKARPQQTIQSSIPVELHESIPTVDPNSPRAPALKPVACSFDDLSSSLHFVFLSPMGDVTITLSEASEGVVSANVYSTSSGFVVVPVPGTGLYSISVVFESGIEYTGQFSN